MTTQEALELQTIVSLVAADVGVALLPKSITFIKNENVVYRTIKDDDQKAPKITIAAAWNKNNSSPVVQPFLNVIKETTANYTLMESD
jgi:DNA-binding transcriptional LysR family regulator